MWHSEPAEPAAGGPAPERRDQPLHTDGHPDAADEPVAIMPLDGPVTVQQALTVPPPCIAHLLCLLAPNGGRAARPRSTPASSLQLLVSPGSHHTVEAAACLERALVHPRAQSQEGEAGEAEELDRALERLLVPRRRKVGSGRMSLHAACPCLSVLRCSTLAHALTR